MVYRLNAWGDGTPELVVLDAATRELKRLTLAGSVDPSWLPPSTPLETRLELFALSPDGTRLLAERPGFAAEGGVLLVRIGGGSQTVPVGTYDDWHSIHVTAAAFAPDGNEIVALAYVGDSDRLRMYVVDIDSGRHRELWSTEGQSANVSWSPDGRFIAVTYMDPEEEPDDSYHSVVLDMDGAVVADHPNMVICGSSRLAWYGEHDLVLAHDDWEGEGRPPLVLADAATGNRREVRDLSPGDVLGVLDGRVLLHAGGSEGTGTYITVATCDGSEPSPFLGPFPGRDIRFFDAVPGLFDTLG